MHDPVEPAHVTVGATHVTIKRRGRSDMQTAAILGREMKDDGEHIWLDRVVHVNAAEIFADGWTGSGPVVTELIHTDTDAATK